MTFIYDNPATFKDDVITGVGAAYSRYVTRVPGASGFVRAGGPRRDKVSLVVGGGSGHYPSYAGIVGRGYADACVLGDIFTSPSAEQVYRVARAADGGAGLVLSFGNYAGDRLNFAAAQERLLAQDIDSRIVYVTDDIASADPAEHDARRGIAGTAIVYKIGGAAADLGHTLDDVERVMHKANTATFSYGVAFNGCTLPGSAEPLFQVAAGKMDFGLGIHGEPGITETDRLGASILATALLEPVLDERPPGVDGRAAIVLNGLGSTKYEELFVLYRHIAEQLAKAGVQPVLPEVGELVTSLDMAGCSVSVTWLDDELAELWSAPADTAAFRRGTVTLLPHFEPAPTPAADDLHTTVADASASSSPEVQLLRAALNASLDALLDAEAALGSLDAVAGDGDHGSGMVRGMRAAAAAADTTGGSIAAVLHAAGDAFGDRAGGTSGILWGIFLSALGDAFDPGEQPTPQIVALAIHEAAGRLQRVGGAHLGDKTMLDALIPFAHAFTEGVQAGASLVTAWVAAADTATRAAADTAHLVPKIGRARPLAHRSVGTPDPGAVSLALILTTTAEVLTEAATHEVRS